MIEQPASREVADQALTASNEGASANAELADELAEVRERLAFYETFDQLIRDNVLRSGELLRQVAAERGQNDQKMLELRQALDQRLAEQRSTLAELATELAGLQANLTAVGDRVAASLAELGAAPAEVPVSGETPAGDQSDIGGPAAMGEAAIAGRVEAMNDPERLAQTGRLPSLDVRAPDLGLAAGAAPRVIEGGRLLDQSVAADVNGTGGEAAVLGRRSIDLIVHGVPKAATALSLHRYLQELSGVESVDVREYVSGVLRFQVVATEFGPEDLLHWPGAGGLEAVARGDHVLELRLVSADG